MHTLAEVADYLGLSFSGDADRELAGLASLANAGPSHLSFLRDEQHLEQLSATRAGAVIVAPRWREHCPADCLLSNDPHLSFALASALFDDTPLAFPGIHSAASVDEAASVHEQAVVAAGAVIEAGATIAEGAQVGAGVYIGHNSTVGPFTRLYPQVVVYHGVSIGERCIVHAGAVLGADGFGYAQAEDGWQKIHQLGGLRIGDGVEIGAGTTVDRGALDDTVIEDGVVIDNQVQIGHNCRIGRNTAIAGCVGVAGSAVIGANCTLAGGVGVVGHVQICDGVHVTGMTMVTRSINEPGSYSSGTPMSATRDWKRNAVRFNQLDAMHRRVEKIAAREDAEPVAGSDKAARRGRKET